MRERRHLIAQHSRFLELPTTGRRPNLAARVLKLVCLVLARDWQAEYGPPVLLVETFVDPNRFRGPCYQAAGGRALGRTKGCARRGQDYYEDNQHPKALWVRPLGPKALARLSAPERPGGRPSTPPAGPVPTAQLAALQECVRHALPDPRQPRGVRHSMVSVLSLATRAVAAGCQGPHAIAAFAHSLHQGQRRQLHCRPRPGHPRQYDVPGERTFERVLKNHPARATQGRLGALDGGPGCHPGDRLA